jgi:hypothetical protein
MTKLKVGECLLLFSSDFFVFPSPAHKYKKRNTDTHVYLLFYMDVNLIGSPYGKADYV